MVANRRREGPKDVQQLKTRKGVPSPSSNATEPAPTLGEIGLQRYAPYLLNQIIGRYNAAIRAELSASGLTIAKMRALGTLSVKNGLTINELAAHGAMEQSTMSRTVDQMETAGLVRREEDSADNRIRRVFITDAGRARFDAVWPAMRLAEEQIFEGLSSRDREELISLLQQLFANMRDPSVG